MVHAVDDVKTTNTAMRYQILAADYDGTIALHGLVDKKTVAALKRLKASGRKLILVTGRELDELKQLFPDHDVFDMIVAENGALLYSPSTMKEHLLGERPPDAFIDQLRRENVSPLSVGRVIVATWEPNEKIVLEAIKQNGIEYQVIFNKGAVMVLPPGINKATGLLAVLEQMKFSCHNLVAVGDAENDNAMLQIAECSAAVANALPSVKEQASFVTTADHGAGVTELIEHLLNNDLADADKNLRKHYLQLGKAKSGEEFTISPYRAGMLLVGSSGGGKSTLTAAFLENLIAAKYQFCLVDPEGDYLDFPDTVIVGDSEHEPVIEELMMLLENPQQNVVVCTLSVPLDRRPEFFNSFLARIMELRKRKAHPHWLVFDEANHMLPAEKEKSFFNLPDDLQNFLLITANPGHLNTAILKHISTVIIVGDHVLDTLKKYADPQSLSLDEVEVPELDKGEALVWDHQQSDQPTLITYSTPKHPTQRHIKKYATGKMEYNNFYFKGPGGKLNLKAYNVIIFMELAEGVDDETWMFHLKRHDYSSWFKDALHNEELADLARVVEDESKDAKSSKAQILKLVSERYTAPE